MVEVEAENLAHTKRFVWLRIRHPLGGTDVILTMPRDFMPHGTVTSNTVLLRYDPKSFHHNGHGFVVEGEIIGKVA